MKTYLVCAAALAFGLVVAAGTFAGGEKKGLNQQDAPKEAKDSATQKSLRDLETASQLIQFGRREKHAESLLVAAQILHRTQTQPLGVEKKASDVKATKEAMAVDNSPKALLAEAMKLSSEPYIVALADATKKQIQEATRGALGGPRTDSFTIQPGQTVNWNPIRFVANDRAEVYIDNGIAGRMILQVFDENGNMVAQDNVPGPYYRCVWYPRWTGDFRFRLTNVDTIPFNCGMATN